MNELNSMCLNCVSLHKGCEGTSNKVWTGCIYRKVKKFRDCNGKLTQSIKCIEEATKNEASTYYVVGGTYNLSSENREYVYVDNDGVLAHFHSFDNHHLFIPNDSLGTFLPWISSEGNELWSINE